MAAAMLAEPRNRGFHAKPALATSVSFTALGSTSSQIEHPGDDRAGILVPVQVVGVRKHLFIDDQKFCALAGSLRRLRRTEQADGMIALELLLGPQQALELDAGILRVLLPPESSLDAEAAWAIQQFESDLHLASGVDPVGASRSSATQVPVEDVSWLAGLKFAGGEVAAAVCQHPNPLYEHEAVRGVAPLVIRDLQLRLPAQVVTAGLLSLPQLQAVCNAAKAFERRLQLCTLEAGVRATSARRGGFLLGDGTGAGKGRVIAALLAHVAAGGGKEPHRCVWVSTSRDLCKDAARDIADLGGSSSLGISLCETGKQDGNVMFVTYATLRKQDSADGVVEWLGGANAKGLIVFDEAHRAKHFAPGCKNSTLQGQMSDFLQRACPDAPVLYASATASTDVTQMSYMPRLGLWGGEDVSLQSPFQDFASFRSFVESRGLVGMEAVALQLKALGLATCRALSQSGAELDLCHVEADSERLKAYDRACDFWQRMRKEAEATLAEAQEMSMKQEADLLCPPSERVSHEVTDEAEGSHQQFWRYFWGCQLRFFRQLVVSMKVPDIQRRVEAALREERQVLIGLWSTGEAMLHAAQEMEDAADEYADVAPGGLEVMLDRFLESKFPCPAKGHVRTLQCSAEAMSKLFGSNLHCGEYAADDVAPTFREALQQHAREVWALPAQASPRLASLGWTGSQWEVRFHGATLADARCAVLRADLSALDLPMHPIDELLDVLGGPSKVAELSGRSLRLVRDAQGCWQREKRHDGRGSFDTLNVREQGAFQIGLKRVAILTEAASSGISLHSDRRRVEVGLLPRPRTLIVAELGTSAEQTLQQLGRVHRSNQLFPPRFQVVLAPVAGEARLAMALARRLKTLGAVTRGDQHGAHFEGRGLGQALESFDVQHAQARVAVGRVMEEFRDKPDVVDVLRRMDGVDPDRMGEIFMGRLLILPVAVQRMVYDRFQAILHETESVALACPQQEGALQASVIDEVLLALGPSAPPLRLLSLEIGVARRYLLTGLLLSILTLFPKSRRKSRLARFHIDQETVSGVLVHEAEFNALLAAMHERNTKGAGRSKTGGAACDQSLLIRLRTCLAKANGQPNTHDCDRGTAASTEASSMPLEDIGVAKVQRVVRRKRTAVELDGKCEDTPRPPKKAREAPQTSQSALQTPAKRQAASDGHRCMARVWGDGHGGQCKLGAAEGKDFCGRHAKEAEKNDGIPKHGRIDGPIPIEKQKAFADFRAKLSKSANASSEREQPQGQDSFLQLVAPGFPADAEMRAEEKQSLVEASPLEVVASSPEESQRRLRPRLGDTEASSEKERPQKSFLELVAPGVPVDTEVSVEKTQSSVEASAVDIVNSAPQESQGGEPRPPLEDAEEVS